MTRLAPRSSVLLLALAGLACGRPKPEAQTQPKQLDDSVELEGEGEREVAKRRAWKRAPAPMPETFAAFPRPDSSALDGVWLVDSEIPGQRLVWIVEDGGTKLTTLDRRGRERIHGVTLTSPCALRLTDEHGRSRSRSIALGEDRLLVSIDGAIAVAATDGSLLACAGHRTYQIAADGRCRYTTEMLGVWSDPAEPHEGCELGEDAQGRRLTIDTAILRERDGVWVDERAAKAEATRFDSREAALAALEAEAAAKSGAGGTAETENGTETDEAKPQPGQATDGETG